MKLLRALTAFVLAASLAPTGAVAAQTGGLTTDSSALRLRALPSEASVDASAAGVAGATPSPATTRTTGSGSGRVIVRFKGSATPSVLSATARSAETSSGTVRQLVPGQYTWRVPSGRSAAQFAAQLQASGRVEYAVPDYERKLVAGYTPPAYASPNDPDFTSNRTGESYYGTSGGGEVLVATYPYGRSWWLRDIHAPAAWAQGYTGPGIVGKYPLRASGTQFTVAVIDSGLYTTHPDNAANVVGGHDFFQRESGSGSLSEDDDVTPVDVSLVSARTYAERVITVSHGTCVSGEIGATVNNGVGTAGVGYDTRVVVHKVMGISAEGRAAIYDSAVIDAIDYSANNGAKVINLSIGGYEYSAALADAINRAYAKGCIIVAAKGNDGSARRFYPASNSHVISVGALDKNARAVTIPADFTNYAKTSLDIMAPGSFVWGLMKPDVNLLTGIEGSTGYFLWDGTSMAAPVVSGAVAWLWRAAPALSNAEIAREMLDSAPRGGVSKRFPSGYRKLDMAAAYTKLKADFPLLTKPALQDQTVASLGTVPVTWGVPLSKLRGVTYAWTVDSTDSGTTSAAGMAFPWTSGDHQLGVQASSAYNWDDGTASSLAVVHVVPSTDGTTTWLGAHVAGSSATKATPAYHAAVTLDATLRDAAGTPLAGATPTLESSTDGHAFAAASTVAVTNLPNGVYRARVAPEKRTWYRFAFAGSGGVLESVSAAAVVIPSVSLSTPYSRSSVSHTTALKVSGKLMPAHASSSRRVRLKIKRWNGHRWSDYSSPWTRVTRRSSSYSTYARTLRLRAGSYHIYAYSPADGAHSATTSGYRTVKVK